MSEKLLIRVEVIVLTMTMVMVSVIAEVEVVIGVVVVVTVVEIVQGSKEYRRLTIGIEWWSGDPIQS